MITLVNALIHPTAGDSAAKPRGPPARRADPISSALLPGGAKQLPEAALRALAAYRALYCSGGGKGEAERDALLRGSYSPSAVFDDNLVRVRFKFAMARSLGAGLAWR